MLLLKVPLTDEKKELAAKRERLGFEIAVIGKRIGFYMWVPRYLVSYVEEQSYAQYPSVHITEVENYAAYRAIFV